MNEKPFKCDLCADFESKWPKNLTRHIREVHSESFQKRKDDENSLKPFMCSVCLVKFGKNFNLSKHKNNFNHWWKDSATESNVEFSGLLSIIGFLDYLDDPSVIAKVLKKYIKFRNNTIIHADYTSKEWKVIPCDDVEEKFYDILQYFIYMSATSLQDYELQLLAAGDELQLRERLFIRHDYLLDLPDGFVQWKRLLSEEE
jgi:hypothetical protein